MSYEFKVEDAYGLARAIGADIHEKGDELFSSIAPSVGEAEIGTRIHFP